MAHTSLVAVPCDTCLTRYGVPLPRLHDTPLTEMPPVLSSPTDTKMAGLTPLTVMLKVGFCTLPSALVSAT
jgi:hypothetical protein